MHSQQALALLSLAEPGPSSHPHGPPNLGQLSALAAAAGGSSAVPVPETQARPSEGVKPAGGVESPKLDSTSTPSTRARGARSANMGSDEWARQRKDNHVRPSVLLLCCCVTNSPPRKKSRDGGVGTSTKVSMNLVASCRTGQARRRKARSFRVRCSTSTISRRMRRATSRNGHWRSFSWIRRWATCKHN